MKLIGREREAKLISEMVQTGQHVLLEGPVGVGKTTLAIFASEKLNRGVVRIDGDGRYTEQKLVGTFDPKSSMEKGFVKDAFVPGPLYQAMAEGKVLLINELNRMPEMVQNVLLPALDEGRIQIPILGELQAKSGFSLIATQNPREFVGTSSLSEALLDRMEWIAIAPFSESEELEIIRNQTSSVSQTSVSSSKEWDECSSRPDDVLAQVVSLMRLTRVHPKVRRGASIRAGIAMAKLLESSTEDFWVIAKSALANRMELEVGKFSNRPYSELLDEVLEELKIELKKKP